MGHFVPCLCLLLVCIMGIQGAGPCPAPVATRGKLAVGNSAMEKLPVGGLFCCRKNTNWVSAPWQIFRYQADWFRTSCLQVISAPLGFFGDLFRSSWCNFHRNKKCQFVTMRNKKCQSFWSVADPTPSRARYSGLYFVQSLSRQSRYTFPARSIPFA